MASLQDLQQAIDTLLQHPLGPSSYQLIQQVEAKAYEAYVFGLCLQAVRGDTCCGQTCAHQREGPCGLWEMPPSLGQPHCGSEKGLVVAGRHPDVHGHHAGEASDRVSEER